MCGNILQYIVHMILLKCENMFAMLILHALILHSDDNIEILPNPICNCEFLFSAQLLYHATICQGNFVTI